MFLHNLWILLMKGLTLISPTLNTKVQYYHYFHRRLDLKHPVTSNEKTLWLKLNTYYNNPLITQCADKYAVRNYVIQCGCKDILNDLLGVWENEKDIDWDKLPNRFVLKNNYGCAMNIIVPDKSQLDIPAATKEMHTWFRSTFHLTASEMQYANIPRKIICERYLESDSGSTPDDYKIYCCDGVPSYVMVCVGRQKDVRPKFYYLDLEGNLQREMTRDGMEAPADFHYDKPEGWDYMIECAKKLTRPFPFVRCDFYICQGKVYFGELTFTPSQGLDNRKLAYTDKLIGDLIQLPNKTN